MWPEDAEDAVVVSYAGVTVDGVALLEPGASGCEHCVFVLVLEEVLKSAGRPVLVTANDYGLGLYNGGTGVTVVGKDGLRAAIASAGEPRAFATSRLPDLETMYAMTIHKSQGSQATEVTVLVPPVDSRLLTRELFYTAVIRAKSKVRVVGSADEVRSAIEKRAVRATGLALRLRG